VVQAVASEQASGISYEDLWAEHGVCSEFVLMPSTA